MFKIIFLQPLVKYYRGRGLKESSSVICTKLLCLFYGGCCLAIAFAAQYLGAILQAALTIFGVVGGPLLGVFTLGMFFPLANQWVRLLNFIIVARFLKIS